MGRGPRILKETVLPAVIRRLIREMKIDINIIVEETDLPYTTVWDWTQGVIPSNPDQLKRLLEFFKKRNPEVTLELLFYGKDSDRDEMNKIIRELREKEKNMEWKLAEQASALNFFQEIRIKEKLEKLNAKDNSRDNGTQSEKTQS